MKHLHNAGVTTFLRIHKDRPGVENFLRKEDQIIEAMNRSLDTDYRDYLDYLERYPEDDAEFKLPDLEALLAPVFVVKLKESEKSEYCCDQFTLGLGELMKPVYIKYQGEFFTVWTKDGQVEVPQRLLDDFRQFLDENQIWHEDELEIARRKQPSVVQGDD